MRNKAGLTISGTLIVEPLSGASTRLVTADSSGVIGALSAGSTGQILKNSGGSPVWGSIGDSDLPATLSANARVAVLNSGGVVGTRRGIRFLGSGLASVAVSDDAGNERVDVTIAVSSSHSHSASDITSGNLDIARLPSGIASCGLGDMIFAAGSNTWSRITGNVATTKKFLTQTGSGSQSSAPAWDTLQSGDIPSTLDSNARVGVQNSASSLIGTRRAIRFLGSGLATLAISDGGANERVDVTVSVPSSHSHAASDIGSGNLDIARLPSGISTCSLGDMIFAAGSNTWSRITGNITTTKQFLIQTGNGSQSSTPSWGTIGTSDLPANSSSSAGIVSSPGSSSNGLIYRSNPPGVPSWGLIGPADLPKANVVQDGIIPSTSGHALTWLRSDSGSQVTWSTLIPNFGGQSGYSTNRTVNNASPSLANLAAVLSTLIDDLRS